MEHTNVFDWPRAKAPLDRTKPATKGYPTSLSEPFYIRSRRPLANVEGRAAAAEASSPFRLPPRLPTADPGGGPVAAAAPPLPVSASVVATGTAAKRPAEPAGTPGPTYSSKFPLFPREAMPGALSPLKSAFAPAEQASRRDLPNSSLLPPQAQHTAFGPTLSSRRLVDGEECAQQQPEPPGVIEGRLYQASAAKELNARFAHLVGYVFLMCWGVSWVSGPMPVRNWFSTRLLLSLVMPRTVAATIWTFLGMMIVFLCRRIRLKAIRQVELNLFLQITRYFTGDFAALVTAHVLSAYFIMNAYYDQNQVTDATARYRYPEGLFGNPLVNPSYLYAQLVVVAVGFTYSLYCKASEKDVVVFPSLTMAVTKNLGNRMPASLANGAIFAIRPAVAFCGFWLLFGRSVLYMSESVFGSFWRMSIVRDPRAGFTAFLPTFAVFVRSTVAAAISCALWGMLYDLTEVVYTEPLKVSESEDSGSLIDGLKLKNKPFLRYHAFLELYNMSETMPRWRAEIFRDIRSAPTVWQQVCWQCLEVINKLSSELEVISTAARGGTASRKKERIVKNLALADPPAHRVGGWQQPAKPPSTFEQRTPSPRKPIKPVESGTIWSPKEPTSPVAQAITSIAAPKPGIPPPIKQIEQLVRRRVTPLATATAADKTGFWARVTRRIRSLPVAHSMLGVDPVLQNRAVYREVQLIVWSTRTLANLVAASLVEDPYGTVQRDVPDILNCFVRCLRSVEEHLCCPLADSSGDLSIKPTKHDAATLADSRNTAASVPIPLGALALMDVLYQSIYKIVLAFRDHLPEMKLDPVLSAYLKPFTELNAL